MRLRFKTMLTVIFILFIICSLIGVGYLFYDKVIVGDTVVIVNGDVTINYIDGNEFQLNEDKELKFSVTNNGSNNAYYYIQFSDINNAEDVSYILQNDDKSIYIENNLKNEIISNVIVISAGQTHNYKLNFKTNSSTFYSGKIIIDTRQNENITFADVILGNNVVNEINVVAFGDPSEVQEGLIKNEDDLGIAYYFRGEIINNYVNFADNLWRIVKINGDGSVKLVLNETLETVTGYYNNDDKSFANSLIKGQLTNWYNNVLYDYSDYISNYKFCNDLTIDDKLQTYIAYNRISKDNNPTFSCLGEVVNSKIGLLTADEVMLAGGSTKENKKYYLYNENIKTAYYTMTSAKNQNNNYYPYIINPNGSISNDVAGNLLRATRPVINIIANASVTGTGTKDDPYVINVN